MFGHRRGLRIDHCVVHCTVISLSLIRSLMSQLCSLLIAPLPLIFALWQRHILPHHKAAPTRFTYKTIERYIRFTCALPYSHFSLPYPPLQPLSPLYVAPLVTKILYHPAAAHLVLHGAWACHRPHCNFFILKVETYSNIIHHVHVHVDSQPPLQRLRVRRMPSQCASQR